MTVIRNQTTIPQAQRSGRLVSVQLAPHVKVKMYEEQARARGYVVEAPASSPEQAPASSPEHETDGKEAEAKKPTSTSTSRSRPTGVSNKKRSQVSTPRSPAANASTEREGKAG